MKKTLLFALMAIACLGLLSSCAWVNKIFNKNDDKSVEISVYIPDGAPLLAIADMVRDGEGAIDKNYSVGYEVVTGAQIAPLLQQGTPDIAFAPINVCAIAFNSNDYVLAGVAVWGLNHIVTRENGITSLEQLKGQTIYAFQLAATPGITLKAVLTKNGIGYIEDQETAPADKVNIVGLSDANIVAQAIKTGSIEGKEVKFALLPEPVMTAAVNSSGGAVRHAFDIQELWGEGSYPQVGVVVKKSLTESHKDFVDKFIARLDDSERFARENPNACATIAINAMQSAGLPSVAVVESFLAGSGQSAFLFKSAQDAKAAVKAYLAALTPNLIGGSQPGDAFYYQG
ncbi:MAG: ABC transporter substrate-binding protein [Clostridiales bacterium]|jgi:ABC-type nitrate/sulfonate/bicarbonate transport system substrate-binding protein|nr:ABC transporter substrate-binding protein [Clostridiales bacterium]